MQEKYVVQMPGLGIAELKKKFNNVSSSRKATVLSDVGILAIREGCKESMKFLIESLNHDDVDVRRVAIDYLGDLPTGNKSAFDVCVALGKTIKKIKNEKGASGLHNFAIMTLKKLERRMVA